MNSAIESVHNENALNVWLPKWPGMRVIGKNVTTDQAAIVLIRTDSLRFSCNDDRWAELLCVTSGIKSGKYGGADYEDQERLRQELQSLSLEYLNNSRIASSWIGGAHGWMDWNGRVFSDNYNIGKHPSASEVFREWSDIAAAFPFIDLTCQLFSGETCEDGIKPLVEYRVANSVVAASVPNAGAELLTKLSDSDLLGWLTKERGCSIDQFRHALRLTRESLAK